MFEYFMTQLYVVIIMVAVFVLFSVNVGSKREIGKKGL